MSDPDEPFLGWRMFLPGEALACPGISERRKGTRHLEGDRRHEIRPCTYTFGRCVEGQRIYIRIRRRAGDEAPGNAAPLHCPLCRTAIYLAAVESQRAA